MDHLRLHDDTPGAPGDPTVVLEPRRRAGRRPGAPRIRCPRCAWEPRHHDRWSCHPGCGTSWNTFDTRGRCPGCGRQWLETACLACHRWSPHLDWYAPGEDAGPPA